MIVSGAGFKKINNEQRRTQNELMFFEDFALFVSFAVYDIFHRKDRKGRKDCLIGFYAINHRVGYELRFVDEHEKVSAADFFIPDYRGKWQSSAMPVTMYEKAAASRFRTQMTRIGRIFTDIVDRYASMFNSSDNKPMRSQRTQSKIEKLWAIRVLDDGLTLFASWITRIYTYPCASVRSVFHSVPSALTYVHPRLISVLLSDRAQKIKGEF